jgi:tRNA (guanine10-N2)-methyltransferase
MADLLDLAARTLVIGGFLCYVIPSFREFDAESDLPRHDCLELIHACYQPLGTDLGRRIVAMKKVQEYDELKQAEYLAHVWKNGLESAEKVANIRNKLCDAAKQKPGYAQKAAMRKQKRNEHNALKKKTKLELIDSITDGAERNNGRAGNAKNARVNK